MFENTIYHTNLMFSYMIILYNLVFVNTEQWNRVEQRDDPFCSVEQRNNATAPFRTPDFWQIQAVGPGVRCSRNCPLDSFQQTVPRAVHVRFLTAAQVKSLRVITNDELFLYAYSRTSVCPPGVPYRSRNHPAQDHIQQRPWKYSLFPSCFPRFR